MDRRCRGWSSVTCAGCPTAWAWFSFEWRPDNEFETDRRFFPFEFTAKSREALFDGLVVAIQGERVALPTDGGFAIGTGSPGMAGDESERLAAWVSPGHVRRPRDWIGARREPVQESLGRTPRVGRRLCGDGTGEFRGLGQAPWLVLSWRLTVNTRSSF